MYGTYWVGIKTIRHSEDAIASVESSPHNSSLRGYGVTEESRQLKQTCLTSILYFGIAQQPLRSLSVVEMPTLMIYFNQNRL